MGIPPFMCVKLVTTTSPAVFRETENLAYADKERQLLMCRCGRLFGQCSAVLCEKPVQFYLPSV